MPYRNPRGPTVGWQPSLRQRRWWAKMARCGTNFRNNYNNRFQEDDQLDDGVPDNDAADEYNRRNQPPPNLPLGVFNPNEQNRFGTPIGQLDDWAQNIPADLFDQEVANINENPEIIMQEERPNEEMRPAVINRRPARRRRRNEIQMLLDENPYMNNRR